MVVFVVQRIDRYSYSYFCVDLVLLLFQAGSCSVRFLLTPFFDLIIRWVESSDFGAKSDDLGHRILKSDFISSDFAELDCISRPILLSRSKNKTQKLGIGSHKKYLHSDRIKKMKT